MCALQGALRILAAIHPPDTTRLILEHLGLPSRAPPLTPALADGELADDGPSEVGGVEAS